ncbi:MAG TPA: hypothetical protein VM513_14785 [Kofleriaceae bacterium]|nr:hypothetical protein [Kofleriaceae bacterium]
MTAPKRSLKERLSALMSEYGTIAIYTYFALSLAAIAGFSIAFGFGMAPTSATGVLGVIGAGWVAAKVTLPLRILATLALTPLIGALIHRRARRRASAQRDGDAAREDHVDGVDGDAARAAQRDRTV